MYICMYGISLNIFILNKFHLLVQNILIGFTFIEKIPIRFEKPLILL